MPSTAGYPKKLTKRVAQDILEQVNEAKQRLKHGQEYRRQKREHQWKLAEAQYEGRHWLHDLTEHPSTDEIVVNMSFSTVNTIVPYSTGSEPSFRVRPFSGDASQLNAVIQQAFLNRLWRSDEVQGQKELATSAIDSLLYGDGFLKVGYDIVERRTSEDSFDDVAELWVMRVSPWDVWIDPSADGLHNARWVAQRIRMTRSELEDADSFYNTHEENVDYGTRETFDETADDHERFMEEVFDGSEYATLYEFYDLVAMRKITFSMEGELPLQYVEDIGALPIVPLPNYRIPRSPYHMGELEQLWPLQQELNRARSEMAQHRRRNPQKYAYRRDKLDQDAIDAIKSSEVNEAIPIDGDEPIEDLIKPLQVPNLTADVYNVSEIVQQDIYEISGVNEYLRGSVPEIRRTATEASIIEGATNVKSQYKLRIVEEAARQSGTLLLAFAADIYPQTNFEELQLYLTGRDAEMVARNDNPERVGDDVVVSPGPDIWRGTYEVVVERSSTELRNPVMRAEKYRGMFLDLVNTYPTLIQAGVPVNLRKVLELWFEAAGIDDIDAMFDPSVLPQVPPEGQAQAEQQSSGMDPTQFQSPENTGMAAAAEGNY